jgi:hypothetical protein
MQGSHTIESNTSDNHATIETPYENNNHKNPNNPLPPNDIKTTNYPNNPHYRSREWG